MGTPAFAVPALEAVAAACEVAAVVTQPDRPSGRGRRVRPSAVAQAAERLKLEVLKPDDMKRAAVRETLAALQPDLIAVVAFGAILSPELLRVPRLGAINLHGSLLPDYRGASPVQRALWEGRSFTGITTLWMDETIDTGDLILQRWTPIAAEEDSGTLGERLARLGAPVLAESLRLAHEGRAPRLPQNRAAGSYAHKLAKEDGVIDWALDAVTAWNRQRAVTPWPGAVTGLRGQHLTVLRSEPVHLLPLPEPPGTVLAVTKQGVAVACAPGALLLTRVKPEARAERAAAEWARGARLERGERLAMEKEAHA